MADYGTGWCSNWRITILNNDGTATDVSKVTSLITGEIKLNDDTPHAGIYKLKAEYYDNSNNPTGTILWKTNINF